MNSRLKKKKDKIKSNNLKKILTDAICPMCGVRTIKKDEVFYCFICEREYGDHEVAIRHTQRKEEDIMLLRKYIKRTWII